MSRRGAGAWLGALAGVSAGLLAMSLLVFLYGEHPREVVGLLLRGTLGTPYGLGQVLYKATPLLATGIAVDLALRAGLFNIGAEGQLAVGGLALGAVAAHLPAGIPALVAVPAGVGVACLAGAAWALVPAVLRARYGAHEVISTIMMNRVADSVVGFGLASGLALPGTLRTPDAAPGARLAPLDAFGLASLRGSAVSVALPLVVAVAFATSAWLARSRLGREIVLVGLSPGACAAERVPVGRRLGLAMVLSGALAGLASVGPVLGYKGYFESGLGAGTGFGGVAVALLGRGHPVGLLLAAVLFGVLEQGGLVVNAIVPREITTVLQGVVVVAVALSDAQVRAALQRGGWRAGAAA